MIELTLVLKRCAIPETVSPARTVYEVGVLDEGFDVEPSPCLVELVRVSFWPTRMRLGLEMLLAEASLALVVPYLAAMPESVSPDFTVCVEGVEVVLVEEDFEEEDDEEDCLVEVVRVSFWPTRMRLGLEMLLAEASLALVVPYLAAMPESVSPDFTVCVDGVDVDLVEEDFEELADFALFD